MKNHRGVSVMLLMLFILSVPLAMTYAEGVGSTKDLSLESKVNLVTSSVYCACGCARQTVQECVCGNAQQLKTEFRNQLAGGATVEQIRNDYIAKFGTQYSALMPAKGLNIVAYVMPAIILLLLGVVVFLVLKSKRESQQLARQPAVAEKKPSTSDAVYEQIEKELERYKRQR